TSTSTAPNSAIAAAAMRRQVSRSPTSPMATVACTPSARASTATDSAAALSEEPLMTTLKPSPARTSATARPILRPAPVIRAVLRAVILGGSSCGAPDEVGATLAYHQSGGLDI